MRLTLHCKPRQAGFTLVELMVVLVLISILTATIASEMRGTMEDARLRATARKIMNVCGVAASRAVTIGHPHYLELDLKEGRYSVFRKALAEDGSGRRAVRDVPGGDGQLDTRISIQFRRAEDPGETDDAFSRSLARSENPDTPTILFYPDGTADPVELLLKDRDGFQLLLRLNPITARVEAIPLGKEEAPE